VNGEIVLDGGSTGSVTVSGSLVANGLQAGEAGGAIKVFGKDINIANNALLDARGDSGGGVIHVGGGWQGSGLAGRTAALTTQVGSNAVLDASAINKGNGGEIAVWSDIHNKQSITNVSGTLLAKGGATAGNGGRIETSGYLLGTTGIRADASATKGLSGEWLLDPFNISIEPNAGASIIPLNGTFFPTNASVINATTINNALNGTVAGSTGTTVTISTGSGSATDGGNIFILSGTNILGPATSSLILHANSNINISNATITVGGLVLNAANGGIDVLANSVLKTYGAFNVTGANYSQSTLFLVAGGSFSATTPYVINPSTPSFINLSNSQLVSSAEIIGGTAGSITMNNATINATADISFESRGATIAIANSNIRTNGAIFAGNQSSAITMLAGGAWTFTDTGRPYNFSAGAASTLKVENSNISMSATSGFIGLLSSGELQITTNSHVDAGEGIVMVSQGGPVRISSSNITVGTGVATNQDAIKGLVTVTGGDFTFDATTGDINGIKLAGPGSSGDIILTSSGIFSATNGVYAAAAGGINVTNSMVSGSNITAVAGGKIALASDAYFSSSNAGVYSRSSSFQLDSSSINSTLAVYSSTAIATSSSGRSKLIGSAVGQNTLANANIFEQDVEADVKFSSTAFTPQISATVAGAISAIQGSLSPSAMLPPPVPQAPPPMQPQPAPQQPVQQNQQPQQSQPQAKQPAPDGGDAPAPAPNQATSNQQPAANKPPPKDGAAADAPDGEVAPQPKQAANDPAAPAPAPAPSAAPRQTANNAPSATAPAAAAPAPTPTNNAAPAPVAPAAPTQVSLAAPPPPVAPPPPTPVATEKPPTPKDAADSGDKTLAMAAPPPPPKAAAQSQASTTRTSVVSPGLVDVQVPVPPRPPSGAAVEQPMPTLGNSARW